MQELKGYVRYRFRSEEEDIDVLLEGEADWVRSIVAARNMELAVVEIGLQKELIC